MLRLKLSHIPLCLMQVHSPNSSELYPEFMKKLKMPCEGLKITNPRSNAHVRNDAGEWKGVICRMVTILL